MLFGTRIVDGMTDALDGAGAGEDRDDISIGDNEDNADVGRLVCGEPEEESSLTGLGIERRGGCGSSSVERLEGSFVVV